MKGQIEWFPVSEKLPDDDTTVMIALSNGEVWMGFRDAGLWRDTSAMLVGDEEGDQNVTHWAHVPAHPEEVIA
jgi:hypothetical protein